MGLRSGAKFRTFSGMSSIDQSIEVVRRVHERIGPWRLAKAAGVPLSTVIAAGERDFSSKPVETLKKLVDAAERLEADATDEAA